MEGPRLNDRLISLFDAIKDRAYQVRTLCEYLNKETTWLRAPISRRGDVSLLSHSVTVADVLLKMDDALESGISRESLVICGLFHDLGKLGGFVGSKFEPRFSSKVDGAGVPEREHNYALAEITLGVRSLYLLSKFVALSEPEVQAIISHEGLYSPQNEFMKFRECRLTLMLHWADYWVSHVQERKLREPAPQVWDPAAWLVSNERKED